MTAVELQYAGSTGFITVGYLRGTGNEKIQAGLLYGFIPEEMGGILHSISLKFIYNPFRIKIHNQIFWEPFQTGVFFSQWFGKNLDFTWPKQYPEDYYWWAPSQRFHVFLGTAVSMNIIGSRWLDHVSFYFTSNTNDLYLSSYFGNHNYKSLSFIDIIFFGTGFKFYFKPSDKKAVPLAY